MESKSVSLPTLSNRELGAFGESIAAQALQTHGYVVSERNWTWIGGEADLIAVHDRCTVFVEVKLRRNNKFGLPEDGVTATKKKRLLETATMYMNQIGKLDTCWRIDVVAIDMTASGKVHRLAIYQDAVRVEE